MSEVQLQEIDIEAGDQFEINQTEFSDLEKMEETEEKRLAEEQHQREVIANADGHFIAAIQELQGQMGGEIKQNDGYEETFSAVIKDGQLVAIRSETRGQDLLQQGNDGTKYDFMNGKGGINEIRQNGFSTCVNENNKNEGNITWVQQTVDLGNGTEKIVWTTRSFERVNQDDENTETVSIALDTEPEADSIEEQGEVKYEQAPESQNIEIAAMETVATETSIFNLVEQPTELFPVEVQLFSPDQSVATQSFTTTIEQIKNSPPGTEIVLVGAVAANEQILDVTVLTKQDDGTVRYEFREAPEKEISILEETPVRWEAQEKETGYEEEAGQEEVAQEENEPEKKIITSEPAAVEQIILTSAPSPTIIRLEKAVVTSNARLSFAAPVPESEPRQSPAQPEQASVAAMNEPEQAPQEAPMSIPVATAEPIIEVNIISPTKPEETIQTETNENIAEPGLSEKPAASPAEREPAPAKAMHEPEQAPTFIERQQHAAPEAVSNTDVVEVDHIVTIEPIQAVEASISDQAVAEPVSSEEQAARPEKNSNQPPAKPRRIMTSENLSSSALFDQIQLRPGVSLAWQVDEANQQPATPHHENEPKLSPAAAVIHRP